VTPGVPSPTSRGVAAKSAGPAQGEWKLTVTATDDIGQSSEMTQAFLVNTTIGFLATNPSKLFLPPRGRDARIMWKQTKTARVTVTVETRAGEVLRTLAKRSYPAGVRGVTWNGLDRKRKAVKGAIYVVRVVARNALGTLDLARNLRVQRIVGPK
jgi:flagellar hook assembly protein FlgD